MEVRAGADKGNQVRLVDHPPPVLGGVQQLEGHRPPGGAAARPLGHPVRSLTVEKVDSIGLVVLR